VTVERLALCTFVESKPTCYISVTNCFNGDETALLSSLYKGWDDKSDESAIAEMFELFSSALHINVMLTSYNNSSTMKA
jgi:hypothetical protein